MAIEGISPVIRGMLPAKGNVFLTEIPLKNVFFLIIAND